MSKRKYNLKTEIKWIGINIAVCFRSYIVVIL